MKALQSKDELDTIPILPEDVPVTMPDLPARLVIIYTSLRRQGWHR